MGAFKRLRLLAAWTAIASGTFLLVLGVVRDVTREPAPGIHVYWREGLSESNRKQLERQFALAHPELEVLAYELLDTSQSNIRALVTHPQVVDTGDLDRQRFDVAGTAPYGDNDTWLIYRSRFIRQPDIVVAIVSTASALLTGSLLILRFVRVTSD